MSFKRTWTRSTRSEGIEALISDVFADGSHELSLPSLQQLEMKSEFNQYHNFVRIPACPFFVPSLLSVPKLKTLSIPCDDGKWRLFDDIRPSQLFALENLCLNGSSTNGSNLSRLLRRCPSLKSLTIAMEFDISHVETYVLSGHHVRISDTLPDYCPKLHTLDLQFKGLGGFFLIAESHLTRLADLKDLRNLRVDLPVLFHGTDDLRNADLEQRLPPNLATLELYDMWSGDQRFRVHYTYRGDSAIYIKTHERVDASADPLTLMLLRLASASSRSLPKLRSVRVKSLVYDHDLGQTSRKLIATFAEVGIDFQIMSFHEMEYCPLSFAGVED
ncbi:hypothetical protein ColLi_06827 [Colletotrichum liriopes]|uniref:F-box domain-containing protein n=1 Tax=Colletotrichum liriopes TaxID=708192 RepID=A0AA37GNL4_9PEZI|nr:hypothetical protein ColLi_06827 [Colletotrichum liriopes]